MKRRDMIRAAVPAAVGAVVLGTAAGAQTQTTGTLVDDDGLPYRADLQDPNDGVFCLVIRQRGLVPAVDGKAMRNVRAFDRREGWVLVVDTSGNGGTLHTYHVYGVITLVPKSMLPPLPKP